MLLFYVQFLYWSVQSSTEFYFKGTPKPNIKSSYIGRLAFEHNEGVIASNKTFSKEKNEMNIKEEWHHHFAKQNN